MSKKLDCLCGEVPAAPVKPLAPFSQEAMGFLSALSARLLKDREAKAYPDVITFAFFCRRSSLEKMRQEYDGQLEGRLGRGICFHVAPSNVPINFAYSMAAALLAGNASVVKASSRDFIQTRIVCRAMAELLAGEWSCLTSYPCVVTYPREEQELTERFSSLCDVRVIWGGDETVRRVREAPLKPRAFDVTFADRYSLLCIRPEAILAMDERALVGLTLGFYNDTYLSDQNACTSPRLVYWVGERQQADRARERFWNAVYACVSARYPVEPVIAVDKLTAGCRAAIRLEGSRMEPTQDNRIVRVLLEELIPGMEDVRSPGGFFLEYVDETLDALCTVVDARYQTLSYVGFEPEVLKRFVMERGLSGIDRIAAVGHTMDFSLVWDGYDLIRSLSRKVAVL
ncbi:MAG: acyl-CoA reductase [Eubacteriales bacterium]|nr:acyl-CoA reductase [Eubacteriales bacterium]